ncbi:MAG: hypothetical protein AB1Z67_09165 [Candidatus Limnocylindrales bacterium]
MDRARRQLRPIRTLSALADSFARESLNLAADESVAARSRQRRSGASSLEVAYVTRWIELDAGRELHGWRTLCRRAFD